MERTKDFAREHGYVATLFGRKIHLPRHQRQEPGAARLRRTRRRSTRRCRAAAADIIKRAMIRMPDALAAARLKARMLLQVHDELLFEVPEKELDKTKDVARKVMESAASLTVPLVVDTGVGDNWAAAH